MKKMQNLVLKRQKKSIPTYRNLKINNGTDMMRLVLINFLLVAFLLGTVAVNGQSTNPTTWVDSVFKTLSLDEKIGQLFIIRAHSDLGEDHINSVKAQIKKYN